MTTLKHGWFFARATLASTVFRFDGSIRYVEAASLLALQSRQQAGSLQDTISKQKASAGAVSYSVTHWEISP